MKAGSTAGISESVIGTIVDLLDEAGDLALKLFTERDGWNVQEKSPGDFVSDADRLVELSIRQNLAKKFPGDSVTGEEFGGDTSGSYWVIDPIDGTSNFLSGLPTWCISLAYVKNGELDVGVVFAPALKQMVVGGLDYGLKVRGTSVVEDTLAKPAFGIGRNGFWPNAERCKIEDAIEARGQSIVTLGSCALSLMFVSLGRLSGYRENHCGGLWDCAGGIALCQGAGVPAEYKLLRNGRVNVAAGSMTLSA